MKVWARYIYLCTEYDDLNLEFFPKGEGVCGLIVYADHGNKEKKKVVSALEGFFISYDPVDFRGKNCCLVKSSQREKFEEEHFGKFEAFDR